MNIHVRELLAHVTGLGCGPIVIFMHPVNARRYFGCQGRVGRQDLLIPRLSLSHGCLLAASCRPMQARSEQHQGLL